MKMAVVIEVEVPDELAPGDVALDVANVLGDNWATDGFTVGTAHWVRPDDPTAPTSVRGLIWELLGVDPYANVMLRAPAADMVRADWDLCGVLYEDDGSEEGVVVLADYAVL